MCTGRPTLTSALTRESVIMKFSLVTRWTPRALLRGARLRFAALLLLTTLGGDLAAAAGDAQALAELTPLALETLFADAAPRTNLSVSLGGGAAVTLRRAGFLHYAVQSAGACLHDGRNRCCTERLAEALLEDAAGLPLCGRFVHQAPTRAGLGHWLGEYNRLIMDEVKYKDSGLQRVQPLPTLLHGISLAEVDETLGISLGVRYSLDQVQAAVARGYLANKTLSDPELAKAWAEQSRAVFYHFPKARVAGANFYVQTRPFFLARVRAQRLRYPRAHATLFAPSATRVCVHVRRGDVGSKDQDRFLPMAYYAAVLSQLKASLKPPAHRLLSIVIISEGAPSDFVELTKAHPDGLLLLSKEPFRHFVHMLYADVLVTSRSGYSHLAAELGDSAVVAAPFWHKYSREKDTVLADLKTGAFDAAAIARILAARTPQP
jgi:hypothetical protein